MRFPRPRAARPPRRAGLRRRAVLGWLCTLGFVSSGAARAQTVALSGSFGERALLVINGIPHTMSAGATVQGVKLLGVSGSEATVEVGGKRLTLALGGAQVNLGGTASAGGGSEIVLSAGSGGHFFSSGMINGKTVNFLVDTGATFVSMGASQAERLGIDYRKGKRDISDTANGATMVYRIVLASVRVGDVQLYDIDALVSPAPMDYVLLGNSFLTRFQMKRENDTMTLTKRF